MIFLIMSVPAGSANDKLKKAEEFFQNALVAHQQGQIDQAIRYLMNALQLNNKMARAHHQLALLYMDESSVQGRFWATFEIEKALRIEPDNLQFLYTQALLNLKKGISFAAERQFKKIIEIDSNFAEVYKQLAALKEAEMLHYQDMISIEPTSEGIIYMQSFADELRDETAEYYKKAMAAKPFSPANYYQLAMLFYEAGNFESMMQLLESAIKINPQDKNCHLFLGLAYQHQRKYDLALQQFNRARELMEVPERNIMESVDLLLTPQEKIHFDSLSLSEKEHFKNIFWKQKDPFYLSQENERELAHFSRVAYANLRFCQPQRNLSGWQSDRGKVYIRYGPPMSKFKTKPYLGEMAAVGRNPLVHSREVWIYPGFSFTFEDEYLSGNYQFARHLEPDLDNKLIFFEKIKNEPDYFQSGPDSLFFQTPLDILAFKGDEGGIELEICYALPLIEIIESPQRRKELSINKGLFIFDQQWDEYVRRTGKLQFSQKSKRVFGEEEYIVAKEEVILPSGNFHFALEFENKTSGKKCAIHEDIHLDSFAVDRIQLSDILFASHLKASDLLKPLSHADFEIVPNPLKLFKVGSPIAIYFEVYNLTRSSDGATRYQIDYRLGANYQQLANWKKLLTAIGLRKQEGEVTTSFEYSGASAKECHYQNISIEAAPGAKNLLVRVTDLHSGQVIEKVSSFTIIE